MSKEKQIEEIAKWIGDADQRCYEMDCDDCPLITNGLGFCKEMFIAEHLYNAGYRKQSEGENEYKKLYEQLLNDFEHALHYAGKNNNVCNFCEHDCGESGVCKGRENWIECNPKWRGIVKGGERSGS